MSEYWWYLVFFSVKGQNYCIIFNLKPRSWPKSWPTFRAYAERTHYPKPKHFETSLWEALSSYIYFLEGIQKSSHQSVSQQHQYALGITVGYFRTLYLNENNAKYFVMRNNEIWEGGSLRSWPSMLSFGYQVNLWMCSSVPCNVNIPIEINNCLWGKILFTVKAIWYETTDLALKYVSVLLGEYILACGFLVFASTCSVRRTDVNKSDSSAFHYLIYMCKCRLTAHVAFPVANWVLQNLVLGLPREIMLQAHVVSSFKLSSLLETKYKHLTALFHRVILQNYRPNSY